MDFSNNRNKFSIHWQASAVQHDNIHAITSMKEIKL